MCAASTALFATGTPTRSSLSGLRRHLHAVNEYQSEFNCFFSDVFTISRIKHPGTYHMQSSRSSNND